MIRIIIFLIFLTPVAVLAQTTITGKVISQADTKPVAHASVFLSNATNGTTTGDDGTFVLRNLTPGKYNLVVSILGFDEVAVPLTIGGQDINMPVITLYPKTISLNAVTVSAKRSDPQWSRAYDKFLAEFLGHTELAGHCKILNAEVLQIHYDEQNGMLKASSSDFLEIENKALGYRIKYLLKDFVLDNSTFSVRSLGYNGYTLFEPMSGTAEQERQWKKNRAKAYEGSQMHFLRAVANNAVDEEGFRVLHLPLKGDNSPDSIIYVDKKAYDALKQSQALPLASGPDEQGIYKLLNHNDRLYITYNKYHRFSKSSYTRLADPGNILVDFTNADPLFDGNGTLLNPQSLVYDGAWAQSGVANLLPVNYADDSGKSYAGAKIRQLVNKLKIYADSLKAEKIYLHFDKPYYAAGDTVYFKAYTTGGGKRAQLSELSGILNVDLINPANKISKAIKLKLEDGVAYGDFSLADTLNAGNYRIRAYTNWMRNDDDGSFFERIIPVGKAEKTKVRESGDPIPNLQAGKAYDIQFLPEGGTLVAGIYSKIAFKAIAANGHGTDVKGTITDDAGNEICKFASAHLGMGVFNIVPGAGKRYTASVIFADGAVRTMPLPPAVNDGYTLTMNASDADTIRLRVTAASGAVVNKLSLIAQSGGVVYYAAGIGSGARLFSAVIPKNRFPSGVVQFTLFSASGEPLNERLVFINNDNSRLKLDLTAKETAKTRERVKISIISKGADNNPVPGNFSVAVTNEAAVPDNEQGENILTGLLLTSDMRGAVENPGYYFAGSDEQTVAALDALMLTQGYRHFGWKNILKDSLPVPRYQPGKTMEISGVVKLKGKPAPAVKVTILTKAGGGLLKDTLSDANGRFKFDNLIFYDSAKFVVQAKVARGQDNVTIDLDTANYLPVTPLPAGDFYVNTVSGMAVYLENQNHFYREQEKYGINKHIQMLKEVIIKDKKEFTKNSQNLNGAGNADRIITADELKDAVGVTLSFRLAPKLFGEVAFRKGMPYSVHNHVNSDPMLIMIDNGEADYDELNRLDPDRVQSVEVLTSYNYGTVYGAKGAAGVLVITTKQSKDYAADNYYRYAPGVVTYMPKGFYKASEFYSPQYDNPHTNQKMADLRSTIYWNPNIITDKDGKASFEYFNADGKGTYRVVIEGIDAEGHLGRQVYRYRVD